jgi:hypothetical protein
MKASSDDWSKLPLGYQRVQTKVVPEPSQAGKLAVFNGKYGQEYEWAYGSDKPISKIIP